MNRIDSLAAPLAVARANAKIQHASCGARHGSPFNARRLAQGRANLGMDCDFIRISRRLHRMIIDEC